MASWDERFQRFYEKDDPQYEKDDDYLDLIMEKHIAGFLKSNPDLMYDHEFVIASFDWLTKSIARSLFANYGRRLGTNIKFAEEAVQANAYVIRDFDISSAPHYSNICAKAVNNSWRVFSVIEPTQCDCILDLATSALHSAFDAALQRKQKKLTNKYTIRFVTNKILPVAAEAGWSKEEQQTWTDRFNTIKFPS
jgi:hypothetical protein